MKRNWYKTAQLGELKLVKEKAVQLLQKLKKKFAKKNSQKQQKFTSLLKKLPDQTGLH